MTKNNKLVIRVKNLISNEKAATVSLERGLHLKYQPTTGKEPFKLTAARVGVYPDSSPKRKLNWPSRVEQGIVLDALFKALVLSGREIAAMPATVDDLVSENGDKTWYGVQWK